MRSTRKRTKARLDAGFVDPDSEELLDLINEDSEPASRKQQDRGKRQKTNAPSAADDGDEDYQPESAADAAHQAAAQQEETEAFSADEDDQQQAQEEGSDPEEDAASDAEEADEDSSSPAPAGKGKQQQQQTTTKKARKKRQSTARMCVTYAKQQFKLTERDLEVLNDVEYRENPHYSRGPPMRLYLVRELEELAAAKAARKAQEAETKEERAAERAMEARARKAAAAAAAAEKAAAFDAHTPKKEGHGSVALPDTCLARIMTCLADSLEPGGLRGPSAVAADLARAAEVCWDFYHAAKQGFIALAEATSVLYGPCPDTDYNVRRLGKGVIGLQNLPGPEQLGGWSFWDTAVQRPTQLKLPQLKDAARYFGLQVTGTKAELMLRVLGAFKLSGPTTAPAALLRALGLERQVWPLLWDGPDAERGRDKLQDVIYKLQYSRDPAGAAVAAGLDRRGAAGLRAAIVELGFNSTTHFLEAAAAAHKERMDRERAEAEAAAARRRAAAEKRLNTALRQREALGMANAQQHQGPLLHPVYGYGGVPGRPAMCRCGNTAAKACSRGCCKPCCVAQAGAPGAAGAAYCIRHKA